MSNEQTVSVSLLAVTSSVGMFTSFLPPLTDVRKSYAASDDRATMVNDVRMGEIAASALAISIGLTASSLAKSPLPAMFAIACAIALVIMYENVLSITPKENK